MDNGKTEIAFSVFVFLSWLVYAVVVALLILLAGAADRIKKTWRETRDT